MVAASKRPITQMVALPVSVSSAFLNVLSVLTLSAICGGPGSGLPDNTVTKRSLASRNA